MKKIRKRINFNLILLYSIFSIAMFDLSDAKAQVNQETEGIVAITEATIRSLLDPFLSKVKKLYEPKIDFEPIPKQQELTPRPEPPVVKEPVIQQVQIKPEEPPVHSPNLQITGIIINKLRPMAIINGNVLEQGEQFLIPEGGVLVDKIERDQVSITYKEKVFTYFMNAEQGNK